MPANIAYIYQGERPWHGVGIDADGNVTQTAEDGTVTVLYNVHDRRVCLNSLVAALPRGRYIPNKRKRWRSNG